jgi:hypothetical protein
MKHILTFLSLLLFSSQVFAQEAPTQSATEEKAPERIIFIQNEFIKIIANNTEKDTGRFAVETTNGSPESPKDNDQPLIYGRPIPWTSYTSILVDGKPFIFGPESRKIQRRVGKDIHFTGIDLQTKTESMIISEAHIGDLEIIQSLQFFRNPQTRVEDMALISYEVNNRGTSPHEVGIRIMMDTKLGSNDGAPFRIGTDGITAEIKYNKDELSDFWQTFDDLSSPNVIAQGILNAPDKGITPPDTLILANWGSLIDHPWDVPYVKGRSFIRTGELEKDTALSLYWNPTLLQPGDIKTVKTSYGLGGVSLSPGELSLGITAPAEAHIGASREFLVMGYVLNSGGFAVRDTLAEFVLPNDFVVVKGQRKINLDYLEAGETRQIPLTVKLSNSATGGDKEIELSVKSSTLEDNQIKRSIELIAPPEITSTLHIPSIKEVGHDTFFDATLEIKNPTKYTLSDVKTTLIHSSAITLSPLDFPQKSIHKLPPFSTTTVNWSLTVEDTSAVTASVSSHVYSKVTQPHRNIKTISLKQPAPKLSITTSLDTIKEGDVFYLDIKTLNTLSPASLTIQFDSSVIRPVRYTLEPSAKAADATLESNTLSLKNMTINSKTPKLPLVKIHFQALSSGSTNVIIQEDSKTPVLKGLTIQ